MKWRSKVILDLDDYLLALFWVTIFFYLLFIIWWHDTHFHKIETSCFNNRFKCDLILLESNVFSFNSIVSQLLRLAITGQKNNFYKACNFANTAVLVQRCWMSYKILYKISHLEKHLPHPIMKDSTASWIQTMEILIL